MSWNTLFRTDNDVVLLAKFRVEEREQPTRALPDLPDGLSHHPQGLPTRFSATDGREGICGGMSAVWLKNMFNKHDVDCTPNLLASALAHANSEFFAAANWNDNVLDLAGLVIVEKRELDHIDAINWMMLTVGSYYISTGNHAMAAVNRNSTYYFFNPTYGALKTTEAQTFNGLAQELHTAYQEIPRYTILWTVIKVRES
jgi:hypothetical protein